MRTTMPSATSRAHRNGMRVSTIGSPLPTTTPTRTGVFVEGYDFRVPSRHFLKQNDGIVAVSYRSCSSAHAYAQTKRPGETGPVVLSGRYAVTPTPPPAA